MMNADEKLRIYNRYMRLRYGGNFGSNDFVFLEDLGKFVVYRKDLVGAYLRSPTVLKRLEKDGLMADSKEEVIERFVATIRWAGRNWYSIPSFEGMRLWLEIAGKG